MNSTPDPYLARRQRRRLKVVAGVGSVLLFVVVLVGALSFWLHAAVQWRWLEPIDPAAPALIVYRDSAVGVERGVIGFRFDRTWSEEWHDTARRDGYLERPGPAVVWSSEIRYRRLALYGSEARWHLLGFGAVEEDVWLRERYRTHSRIFNLPLWPIGLGLGVLVWWSAVRRRRQQRRLATDRCVICGYDLRATPERCPECGTELTKATVA